MGTVGQTPPGEKALHSFCETYTKPQTPDLLHRTCPGCPPGLRLVVVWSVSGCGFFFSDFLSRSVDGGLDDI